MTKSEIATSYLTESNGNVETAFQNLCADAAEMMEQIKQLRRTGYYAENSYSVRAMKLKGEKDIG